MSNTASVVELVLSFYYVPCLDDVLLAPYVDWWVHESRVGQDRLILLVNRYLLEVVQGEVAAIQSSYELDVWNRLCGVSFYWHDPLQKEAKITLFRKQ